MSSPAQAQFQGRRLQGPQHLPGYQGIEDGRPDAVAPAFKPVPQVVDAVVPGPRGTGDVVGLHARAAAGTDHDPRQQGAALARGARLVKARPVAPQPLLVRDVLIPADVRRHLVVPDHLPLVDGHPAPAALGPAQVLAFAIDLAAPVGIRARVHRVAQDAVERRPARAAPFELPAVRPLVRADADSDAVVQQVVEDPRGRAQLHELVEDDRDDRPHLLVGVEGHAAGR